MRELTEKELFHLGRVITEEFHLMEQKGKFLTKAGWRTYREIGLMTWLLVNVTLLIGENEPCDR